MRGRPLLEFLVFVVLWGLLFVPLRAVTQGRIDAASAPVRADTEAGTAAVWVRIQFTEAPLRFVLYSRGEPVWEEADPSEDQEHPIQLVEDVTGREDLLLEVFWAIPGRRATEIRLSPPLGSPHSIVLWHHGDVLREVLLLP
jgi:hypothetical protein